MYDEARLEVLLDGYFDQELTAAERKELEKLLLASGRARDIFWERAQHHSSLRQWGMQEWGRKIIEESAATELDSGFARNEQRSQPTYSSENPETRHNVWLGWWGWASALAACIALFMVLRQPSDFSPLTLDDPESPDEAVAVLTRTAGVTWESEQTDLSPGAALQPGWLRLKEGLVNLEFYSGARLVIEGPAEVQLVSSMEAYCQHGKINAYVPAQAHGFKVRSPEMDVVDLGTAFALNVPTNGRSEVHVFSGEVELTRVADRALSQKLLEGQALRVNELGETSEIAAAPLNFASLAEVEQRQHAEMARRFENWKLSNQVINEDSATLVHYTFEGEPNGDRRVKNSVRNPAPITEGSLVSCEWTAGRWPGKNALDFKSRADRVRLGIPGQHEALTYIAWIRVDSLPRTYNGLLLSDDLGVGEARWEVSGKGELRFGVRVASNVWERAISPPTITPDRFGQWIHVATVFDAKSRTVQHYVDGRQVAAIRLNQAVPVKLGNSQLGNWGVRADNPKLLQNDETHITRPFTGKIDEFILSSRPFTAQEIQERYQVGKPLAATAVASAISN